MNKEFLISKAEKRKRDIANGSIFFHYPRDCQDEIVDVALAIIKTISEMRHIKVSIIKYGLQMASDIIDEASQNDTITESEKVTRNAMILKVLDEMTNGKEVVVENLDSIKDIFNESLDPAIAESAVVITNQAGFNYLDKLKDNDGNYILQRDPSGTFKGKLLFGEYPIIKMSKRTLASKKVMNSDGIKVDALKHPIYCGDLKSAVTLFDRNVLTIDINDKGASLWEKDQTGVKVRDRFDVRAVDKHIGEEMIT